MTTRVRTARWLLPALAVLVWVAIGVFGAPFAGKLGSVQTNDNSAFLPGSAESTKVLNEMQKFGGGNNEVIAIVVAERTSGVTPADKQFVAQAVHSVAGKDGIGQPIGEVQTSPDGQALAAGIGVHSDPQSIQNGVTALRGALANGPPSGLDTYVTGPAGESADFVTAIGGIDGVLLLVAGAVVILILIIVYRSPILPFVVLISAIFALGLSSAVVYYFANNGLLTLNAQSQGIMFILVFGAATDYALLLVSRYREELHRVPERMAAIRRAWRATVEPIAASAGTVILGLMCLLLSDLNSNKGLGPVAAIGIAAALLASLTFLPAVLVLFGRVAFWPRRPRYRGDTVSGDDLAEGHPWWWRLSVGIGKRPRELWIVAVSVLVIFVSFVPQFRASGTAQSDVFLTKVQSVTGMNVLTSHFPGGDGNPAVIITNSAEAKQVAAAASIPGVENVTTVKTVDGRTEIQALLAEPSDSEAAMSTVQKMREAVHAVPGADALVGGQSAILLDVQNTSVRDRTVIIPVVLLVVLVVLALLLRALIAPLVLIATVVLSFAATLGVSSLVFNDLLDFPGADPAIPLFGFIFLVALGIDYNIFLMTRVREETAHHGPRRGVIRGLAVTGGVITSAGVVLAATFASLSVIPLLFLAQIAFIVAFGVLLDTLLVRTVLVPALTLEIGRWVWWPSKLARRSPHRHERPGRSGDAGRGAAAGRHSAGESDGRKNLAESVEGS